MAGTGDSGDVYVVRQERVRARLFSGRMTRTEAAELAGWCGGAFHYDPAPDNRDKTYYWSIRSIPDRDPFYAVPGDWIVLCGPAGRDQAVRVCSDDDFKARFEVASHD